MAEALPYFPADSDPRFATLDYDDGNWTIRESDLRQRAAQYGDALQAAGNAWGRTTRAEAWYAAAKLARRDGMRIMGYEPVSYTHLDVYKRHDVPWGRVFRVDTQGRFELIAEYDGEPNGLKIHQDGRIFIADYARGIMLLDPQTGSVKPVLERVHLERLKACLLYTSRCV